MFFVAVEFRIGLQDQIFTQVAGLVEGQSSQNDPFGFEYTDPNNFRELSVLLIVNFRILLMAATSLSIGSAADVAQFSRIP